jgi:hypothetical protein
VCSKRRRRGASQSQCQHKSSDLFIKQVEGTRERIVAVSTRHGKLEQPFGLSCIQGCGALSGLASQLANLTRVHWPPSPFILVGRVQCTCTTHHVAAASLANAASSPFSAAALRAARFEGLSGSAAAATCCITSSPSPSPTPWPLPPLPPPPDSARRSRLANDAVASGGSGGPVVNRTSARVRVSEEIAPKRDRAAATRPAISNLVLGMLDL